MTQPSYKPILKYPGSKYRLAPWIISFFPAHHHYVEPYAGSAAVFFAKTPSPHEVLNDTDGDLVNLFTVIREQGEALARQIEMTPWAEAEYLRVERRVGEGDMLERARRFLIRCWRRMEERWPTHQAGSTMAWAGVSGAALAAVTSTPAGGCRASAASRDP